MHRLKQTQSCRTIWLILCIWSNWANILRSYRWVLALSATVFCGSVWFLATPGRLVALFCCKLLRCWLWVEECWCQYYHHCSCHYCHYCHYWCWYCGKCFLLFLYCRSKISSNAAAEWDRVVATLCWYTKAAHNSWGRSPCKECPSSCTILICAALFSCGARKREGIGIR